MPAPTVRRPALRYYGSKFRLAPWVIGHFPVHECYVEPFGGAMSVLLRKRPSRYEVYNDLDQVVVTFFRVLRDRPEDLVRAIELTPYSHSEQRLAFAGEPSPADELEVARRLYVRCWQSYGGGRTQWRTGWRFDRSNRGAHIPVHDIWRQIDHLPAIVARLKRVQIECDDGLTVIRRFDAPGTLFYLDPPYLASTRSHQWCAHAYQVEMDEAQHVELADTLASIQGMAIISGYDSPLYRELYAGWRLVCRSAATDFQGSRLEHMWISPRADANVGQRRML